MGVCRCHRDPARPRTRSAGATSTAWHTRFGRWLVSVFVALARVVRPAVGRVAAWSAANLAFVVFAVIALVLIALLVEGIEQVYENVTDRDGLAGFDQPVLDWMVAQRTPGLDSAVTAFTDLGGAIGMPIIASVAVIAIALWRRSWTPVVLAVIAAAGSVAMTVVGKDMIDRARPPADLAVPPLEVSPSFPSGHTLNATVLITVVVYLVLIETTATWQRVVAVTTGHRLRRAHGPLARLPRPPLAHRRGRRLAHRARLGSRRHHRAPALAHPPGAGWPAGSGARARPATVTP